MEKVDPVYLIILGLSSYVNGAFELFKIIVTIRMVDSMAIIVFNVPQTHSILETFGKHTDHEDINNTKTPC